MSASMNGDLRGLESSETGGLGLHMGSVADPDPGSGAFLTSGSGIRNRFFPYLGSQIPNPYFRDLCEYFLGKKFYNSLKIGPNYFL
jgi:hypothetical protein